MIAIVLILVCHDTFGHQVIIANAMVESKKARQIEIIVISAIDRGLLGALTFIVVLDSAPNNLREIKDVIWDEKKLLKNLKLEQLEEEITREFKYEPDFQENNAYFKIFVYFSSDKYPLEKDEEDLKTQLAKKILFHLSIIFGNPVLLEEIKETYLPDIGEMPEEFSLPMPEVPEPVNLESDQKKTEAA